MADLDQKMPPECFARLEKVFPMGADGLRHTPPECLACDLKTECLRSALAGEKGLAVHEERLARAYQAGSLGFFERWAQQKDLQRCRKTRGGRRNFWSRFRRCTRADGPEEDVKQSGSG
jgi:hypothetical protein